MGSPMLVPPWLETLLSTPFFSVCRAHDDSPTAPRSECNMFCLDCATAPAGKAAFCYCCRDNLHKGHQVIQIRRSSYHDVVRVSEVQRALDISGVQTYVINSARVMFLNERPQPRSTGKASAHICEICNRSLLDPFRFCSLGCKLAGIKRNRNASFVVMKVEDQEEEEEEGKKKELSSGLREEGQHAMYNHTHSSSSPPKAKPRRRKGVPHRSPLGT